MAMTFGSLFAGIGGIDLGLERAGMQCAWQVEIDPYCQRVLAKHWPNVRRHDDVRTFPPTDPGEWSVDLVAGGFPCQPVSNAGKQLGDTDERWLWPEFARVLRVLQPRYALLENVSALLSVDGGRLFGTVLGDLAALGFDAEWSVLSACSLGAPHARERVFLIAYADEVGRWTWPDRSAMPPRCCHWQATEGKSQWEDMERWISTTFPDHNRTAVESATVGILDGVSRELECAAYGNAVVPQIVEWLGRRILECDSQLP